MTKSYGMEHHQWDSSFEPQVVPLILALQWARDRSLEVVRPVWARHGLSAAEFDVLATLRNSRPPHELTPAQVQDQVVITSGGLTKVMLQLEARGLVARLQLAGDRRVKPVRLSAAGRRLIEKAMAEMVAASAAWLRGALSAAELATLTKLLGKALAGGRA